MPFETGNHWYYFSFANEQDNNYKGYLYDCNYNDTTTDYIALGQTSGVIEKELDNDKYLWCIEGTPFDGLKIFTEDALMNTSTVLSDETNDDDAIQWSQKQNNDNNGGGLWQYMDE